MQDINKRSEERRVGKEKKYEGWTNDQKKKNKKMQTKREEIQKTNICTHSMGRYRGEQIKV